MTGVDTIGVVGLGAMGAGILEVFAKQGLHAVAVEIDQAALERGQAILKASLARAVERGRMEATAADEVFDSINWTVNFDELATVDLVIEAVPERMDIKKDLFGRLDALCKPETIFATNTSSLSVTQIAAATSRPERVIGMHFFNPAPVMKLVEVVTTVRTDSEVAETVRTLAQSCGKSPVVVGDRAGFIANTLLISYLNDAIRVFDSNSVTREGMDAAMSIGAMLPMGPLTLCDLIGLDVCLEVMDVLFAESRDPVHAPAPLLRSMVSAGLLGRKTGQGFYTYEKPGSGKVVADADTPPAQQPLTIPSEVVVVGEGIQIDEFVQVCGKVGVDVRRMSYNDFDPTLIPADLPVVVGVMPIQRATDISAQMGTRRGDVVGVHTLFPNPKGQMIEVAKTPFTRQGVIDGVLAIAAAAEVTAVICDDQSGLVIGRLLVPYFNDAARMLSSGYASAEDIDTAMTLGCGYPNGPITSLEGFTMATICDISLSISRSTQFPRHLPTQILIDAVTYGVGIRQMASGQP